MQAPPAGSAGPSRAGRASAPGGAVPFQDTPTLRQRVHVGACSGKCASCRNRPTVLRSGLEAGPLDSGDRSGPDRGERDILHELLLKLGPGLRVPIETGNLEDESVHVVGAGTSIACLDQATARADAELPAQGMADRRDEAAPAGETAVVSRDSAFAANVAKTSPAAVLQRRGRAARSGERPRPVTRAG